MPAEMFLYNLPNLPGAEFGTALSENFEESFFDTGKGRPGNNTCFHGECQWPFCREHYKQSVLTGASCTSVPAYFANKTTVLWPVQLISLIPNALKTLLHIKQLKRKWPS